jgi:hypothetical protein
VTTAPQFDPLPLPENRIDSAPREQEFTEGVWNFYTLGLGLEYAAAAAWRDAGS